MSWRASSYIKQLSTCPNGAPITRAEKFVALILADSHQDKMNVYTFPSVLTIAADAVMDERTCRRILRSLEVKGVITRDHGDHQGRGHLTFYRFPALDEEVKSGPPAGKIGGSKGGQNARLFFDERGTKGGQKGDKMSTPLKGINRNEEPKQKLTPPAPPARRGDTPDSDRARPGEATNGAAAAGLDTVEPAIENAVDAVMQACGFTKRRVREALRAVVVQESDKGRPPATVALDMAAAWKKQSANAHLLEVKYTNPLNFFGLPIWKDANLWHWDRARIEREQAARAGSWAGPLP